ncbi:SDR family oxidoreductase [Sporichthya sp.]|uniref:SDR family oxidoreductase n=1 Tax=Sporichthya sp. TaxID=65475 RepID=UPI0017A64596|nr:SDR family oxidoreductase [Sporichthya sp.]MBA3741386.1 SDR family NAD(P)-dependent oxidoreductase [Sporichthya sp.]
MAGICQGRIVIVTGAGGGIGREHARLFAAEGAKVVVNDLGTSAAGEGSERSAAQVVADEIAARGGLAVANADDVSAWDGAERLVRQAIDTFGGLDVLVNNAGILRDKMFANMDEASWDAVVKVHLKGTFAPSRHAVEYWRSESKAGREVDARIINTTSASGIYGNVGQSNYGAAKAGIAAMTVILAQELEGYGITVNAVAPSALTRMTEDLPQVKARVEAEGGRAGHSLDPVYAASPVVWLGSGESRGITGRVFSVSGTKLAVNEGWVQGPTLETIGRPWTPEEIGEFLPQLVKAAASNATMAGTRP